jgi:hypothetical protein
MMIKEGGQNTISIYGRQMGEYITSLVMFTDNGNDCVLIHLSGQFTLKDIHEIIAP